MDMIGVLTIPADERVRADLERWSIRRTIALAPHGLIVEVVSSRAKGAEVMVFASGRRRWHDVAEALRAAVQVAGGVVGLRFYGPDMLLAVRLFCEGTGRYVLCPTVELAELQPEGGGGYFKAVYRIRRAVKDALADLMGAEMRALAEELRANTVARVA